MTDADAAALRAQLTRHEGLRLFPYRDTAGKITIGVGRNLTDRGLSNAEAQELLTHDIDGTIAGLVNGFPWFAAVDGVRQGALINLAFNLGLRGFATFTTFLALCAAGDWIGAAADLVGTAWYRQVGQRGRDLVQQLRTGIWVNPSVSSSAMDTGTDVPHGGAS